MPYPPHYLLSWGGDFVSDPVEVWNNNLRLAVDDNVDLAQHTSLDGAALSSALADMVTRVSAHVSSTGAGYSSNVRLRYVKLNEIGPDGLYKSKSDSNTTFLQTPVTSQAGASTYPLATALVATFLTARERGPGSRGRVFIPHPQTALSSSTFRITSANLTNLATTWRTFLDGIDIGVPGSPIVPSVVSDRGVSGVAATINQVQFGDVLDYMGSRRNRLKENRVTSATFN